MNDSVYPYDKSVRKSCAKPRIQDRHKPRDTKMNELFWLWTNIVKQPHWLLQWKTAVLLHQQLGGQKTLLVACHARLEDRWRAYVNTSLKHQTFFETNELVNTESEN